MLKDIIRFTNYLIDVRRAAPCISAHLNEKRNQFPNYKQAVEQLERETLLEPIQRSWNKKS